MTDPAAHGRSRRYRHPATEQKRGDRHTRHDIGDQILTINGGPDHSLVCWLTEIGELLVGTAIRCHHRASEAAAASLPCWTLRDVTGTALATLPGSANRARIVIEFKRQLTGRWGPDYGVLPS